MSGTYVFRLQAVEAARRAGHSNFRTWQKEDGMWAMAYEPGSSLAEVFIGKGDYISHAETDWDRTETRARKVGVLVVTCRLDEIPKGDLATYNGAGIRLEPLTPSLWDKGEKASPAPKVARAVATGVRERSDAVSPVKTVWRIAGEMKGQPRAEVVAACVAAGVHKSTASTQFYRWQKAQGGSE